MITETSGFMYLGTDCGYKWIPSAQRGLPPKSSLGVPLAVIMDEQVVATFGTYPPIWDAIKTGTIVDVTSSHDVPDGHAVVEIRNNGETTFTIEISNELLAAALTSNPTIVEITEANRNVIAGWRYIAGAFHEPV
jgi:hypothetical protein